MIILALIALLLLWRIAHHLKRSRVKRYRPGTRAHRRLSRQLERDHERLLAAARARQAKR